MGPLAVALALLSALVTFIVLADLTPISPTHYVVVSLLAANAATVLLLLGVIVREVWQVVHARRRQWLVEDVVGRRHPAGRVAVRDAEDRLRVVAAALVDQLVPARRAEAVHAEEVVAAALVVLRDRLEDVLTCHGGEGSHPARVVGARSATCRRGARCDEDGAALGTRHTSVAG